MTTRTLATDTLRELVDAARGVVASGRHCPFCGWFDGHHGDCLLEPLQRALAAVEGVEGRWVVFDGVEHRAYPVSDGTP